METKKEKNVIFQMVFPAIIFIVFLIAILFGYSKKLNKIYNESIEEKIDTETALYSVKIQKELSNLAKASAPVADMLGMKNGTESEALNALESRTPAFKAVLLKPDGRGIDSQGSEVFYDPALYESELRLGKSTYHYFGEGTIAVMTPIMKEANVENIILLEYDASVLREQFANFDFGRETWIILVDDEGSIMYSFSGGEADYITVDNNFYNMISETQNGKVFKLLDDATKKISGKISLQFGEDAREIFYKPLGINDWYILIGVPENYMELWQGSYKNTVSDMIKWIMAGMALFLGMVAAFNVADRIRRKTKSAGLLHLAETDQLTNLYNKVTTEKKIKEFMEQNPTTQSLLFVLDIDNFKKINDTMGHAFGDEVLRSIGHGIKMQFRASDIIGRVGGDEFIIFLKGLKDEEIIIREAKKVENFFKDFKAGKGYVKYSATASIGCAVFPRDAEDFEGMYKAADEALYKAKQRGKNQLAFYKDPE